MMTYDRRIAAAAKMEVSVSRTPQHLVLSWVCRMDVDGGTDSDDFAKQDKAAYREAVNLTHEFSDAIQASDRETYEDFVSAKDFVDGKKKYLKAINGGVLFHYFTQIDFDVDLTPAAFKAGLDSIRNSAKIG